MAAGLAVSAGLIPVAFALWTGRGLKEALLLGIRVAAWAFLISLPVVALLWRFTHRGADVVGNVFFSAQDGRAASRGFSAERAMARGGRGDEALEILWGYYDGKPSSGAPALWELLDLARRHSLKHPLVARSAQRLFREPDLSELDRRRLQEILNEAAAGPEAAL